MSYIAPFEIFHAQIRSHQVARASNLGFSCLGWNYSCALLCLACFHFLNNNFKRLIFVVTFDATFSSLLKRNQ